MCQRKIIIFIFYLFVFTSANAQNHAIADWGGQIGILYSFGSHSNRLGVMSRFFYQFDFIQFNLQSAIFYNFKSLGSEKKGWEANIMLGSALSWGKKRNNHQEINPFLNPLANQTSGPHSIGYAYIIYLDGFGTTQRSGAFGLQFNNFRFYFENDFLGFQSMDKYRTGAMALFYRWKDWQFGLKQIAFTGDPYEKLCPWIEDEVFPSRSGFIDMTSAPLGNKSVGILALQVERRISMNSIFGLYEQLPTDQYAGIEIGIDAEQIRNLFQNKLVHDSKLLPLNWGDVKNPHIPMICDDGCPFLYHENQKIRNPKLYLQTWLNNAVLY